MSGIKGGVVHKECALSDSNWRPLAYRAPASVGGVIEPDGRVNLDAAPVKLPVAVESARTSLLPLTADAASNGPGKEPKVLSLRAAL